MHCDDGMTYACSPAAPWPSHFPRHGIGMGHQGSARFLSRVSLALLVVRLLERQVGSDTIKLPLCMVDSEATSDEVVVNGMVFHLSFPSGIKANMTCSWCAWWPRCETACAESLRDVPSTFPFSLP